MANVNRFKVNPELDAMVAKEIPSQIPVLVTRVSYARMIKHCTTDYSLGNYWACSKNGAQVHVKVMMMNIFEPGKLKPSNYNVPIGHLFCSACDKKNPPQYKGGDGIWSTEIMSVTL